MTTEPGARRNVYLIGPRASGKTSLGRALAKRLKRSFVDLDALAVAKAGESIAQLVAREGWPAFRKLESGILAEVAESRDLVAATGGGVILDAANRERMRSTGVVVLLWATPEVLLARLESERLADQRPALTELSWEEEMRQTLAQREPLYRECAHLTLDAATPLDELTDEAADKLASFRP